LGVEEAKLTKAKLNCLEEPFFIAPDTLAKWRKIGIRNNDKATKWQETLANSKTETKDEFNRLMSRKLPDNWHDTMLKLKKEVFAQKNSQATRQSSGQVLESLTKEIPELVGGSADLTGSNNTKTSHTKSITNQDFSGRYIHYGIREHAMGAIMNGIALHKGFIPYSGTFLVFSDYCKPAIRMSALMQQKVIYVMTHDSIGLGEDGPTHQPIEHLESMRSIPNLLVLRPCDIYETLECWQIALTSKQPILMSLTRQKLAFSVKEYHDENRSNKGAYIISKEQNKLQATIIATGSEVEIALKAQEILSQENIGIRVVSMPCFELFDQQDVKYHKEILGNTSNIIAVEAAYSPIFYKYAKKLIGLESFGASGKYEDLYKHFGITADNIINTVKDMINEN
jgi:transketolase